MKSLLSIAVTALFAFQPTAQSASPAIRTWTGEVSSSNCGVAYTPGRGAGDFTRECVDRGSAYVLVVANDRAYRFANQADRNLRTHAGERVTVTGELEGGVITASSIEAME
jgi:hypothetical protein